MRDHGVNLADPAWRPGKVTAIGAATLALAVAAAAWAGEPPAAPGAAQPAPAANAPAQGTPATDPLAGYPQAVAQAIAQGKPDLNMLFIYNIPFRGMAKMMNGMVTRDMAEDIVTMVNGHWHKGLGRLSKHFFHKPELGKQ